MKMERKAGQQPPPNIVYDDSVILFDGACKLCNAWVNFIIEKDSQRLFKLCAVQSEEGQSVLAHFNLPTKHFDTMLYIHQHRLSIKSDAFLAVISQLGYPYKVFKILQILPLSVRDWVYDRIALNRYALFGKYQVCQLPDLDHQQRFINNEQ